MKRKIVPGMTKKLPTKPELSPEERIKYREGDWIVLQTGEKAYQVYKQIDLTGNKATYKRFEPVPDGVSWFMTVSAAKRFIHDR